MSFLRPSPPRSLFASAVLESVYLTKNQFTGELPCMSHSEPNLKKISLSQNFFSGDMKPCLFTSASNSLRPGDIREWHGER